MERLQLGPRKVKTIPRSKRKKEAKANYTRRIVNCNVDYYKSQGDYAPS